MAAYHVVIAWRTISARVARQGATGGPTVLQGDGAVEVGEEDAFGVALEGVGEWHGGEGRRTPFTMRGSGERR